MEKSERERDLDAIYALGRKVDDTFRARWEAEEAHRKAQDNLRRALSEFGEKDYEKAATQ